MTLTLTHGKNVSALNKTACYPGLVSYNFIDMIAETYPVPRRSERKPVRKAVVLMVESEEGQAGQEATAIDISDHGMRIQGQVALTPGQVLHLIQAGDPSDPLRCVVVWASDIASDGKGDAGLEFLKSYPAIPNS